MPIDLYQIAASPPCRSVIMAAEYLGIELNLKHVDLFTGQHLRSEYLKINPTHTVPAIDDNGFILWESRAILTYLANKYAPDSAVYPKDPKARAIVDRMLHFDVGLINVQRDVHRPIMFKGEAPDPEKVELYHKNLKFLEEFLGRTAYVAGNHLTLADFALIATISMAKIGIDFNFDGYPSITAWIKKLEKEIPRYKEINVDSIQKMKEHFSKK